MLSTTRNLTPEERHAVRALVDRAVRVREGLARPEAGERTVLEQRILVALEAGPLMRTQLRTKLSVSTKALIQALSRLTRDQLVRREPGVRPEAPGRYLLVEPEDDVHR
jgi:hypothetical protein